MHEIMKDISHTIIKNYDLNAIVGHIKCIQDYSGTSFQSTIESLYNNNSACHFPASEFAEQLSMAKIVQVAEEHDLHAIGDTATIVCKAIESEKELLLTTIISTLGEAAMQSIASGTAFPFDVSHDDFSDLLDVSDGICSKSDTINGLSTLRQHDPAHAFNSLTIMINKLNNDETGEACDLTYGFGG